MLKKLALASVGLITLAGLVYYAGLVFEAEFPYYFWIRKAAHATTPGGKPVSEVIARAYPNQRYHWHTCSYCDNHLRMPGVRPMWLHTIRPDGGHVPRFLVAFHWRTNTMVLLNHLDDPALKELVPLPGTAELRHFHGTAVMVPYAWRLGP